jgi:hypothetical protein
MDDVGVRELGEVLALAEGGRGDAVLELGDDLDLLDGDEDGRVVLQAAAVDIGVGSFTDLLLYTETSALEECCHV